MDLSYDEMEHKHTTETTKMKNLKNEFTFVTLLTGFICFFFTSVLAENEGGIDKAEKLVLKVNENGFEPKSIKLHQADGSIFVVNTSKASLLTLKVDFKGRKMHCASGNLEYSNDGVLKSKTPIAPKDFAIFCLPESGSYELFAYGLGEKPFQAQVVAE